MQVIWQIHRDTLVNLFDVNKGNSIRYQSQNFYALVLGAAAYVRTRLEDFRCRLVLILLEVVHKKTA